MSKREQVTARRICKEPVVFSPAAKRKEVKIVDNMKGYEPVILRSHAG
jgi:hypothetical protein